MESRFGFDHLEHATSFRFEKNPAKTCQRERRRFHDAEENFVVDDSKTILQMERMILQQDRYEVVTARDGQEGVTKALELKPNLILMDVIMPRLDGFAVVKHLRTSGHEPRADRHGDLASRSREHGNRL